MGLERFIPKQINAKLRELAVIVGQCGPAAKACCQIGIAERALYQWLCVQACQWYPADSSIGTNSPPPAPGGTYCRSRLRQAMRVVLEKIDANLERFKEITPFDEQSSANDQTEQMAAVYMEIYATGLIQ